MASGQAKLIPVTASGEDLFTLLDELRERGFPIGLDEYLTAQDLASSCQQDGEADPLRLRNWLAPALCSGAGQQREFYRAFDDWWLNRVARAEVTEKPQGEKPQAEIIVEKSGPAYWLLAQAVLITILGALLIGPPQVKERKPTPERDVAEVGMARSESALRRLGSVRIDGDGLPGKNHILEARIRVEDVKQTPIVGAEVSLGTRAAHEKAVTSLHLSADGQRVLTSSADGTARIWNASDGLPVAPAMTHDGPVGGAVLSHDESQVLSWSDDGTVRLWDSSEGTPLVAMRHSRPVRGGVFSHDDDRVLSWSSDEVRLWSAADRVSLGSMAKREGEEFLGAAFSDDQVLTWSRRVRLLGLGTTLSVRRWDVAKKFGAPASPELVLDTGVSGAVMDLALDRALTWSDETANLWNLLDGTRWTPILKHEWTVLGATLNNDGSLVLSWGGDREAAPTRQKPLGVLDLVLGGSTEQPRSTGGLGLWNVSDGSLAAPAMNHDSRVLGAVFSSDESKILSWSEDGAVQLWNVADGSSAAPPMRHDNLVSGAAFGPEEDRVISWCSDGTSRLWDTRTGEAVQAIGTFEPAPSGKIATDGEEAQLSVAYPGLLSVVRVTHPDFETPNDFVVPPEANQLRLLARMAPLQSQLVNAIVGSRAAIGAGFTLFPLVLAVGWLIWKRHRRNLVLERRTTREQQGSADVGLPEPEHQLYRGQGFRRARVEARRHRMVGTGELNHEQTVLQTIQKLGCFSPVYWARRELPVYLALIDRSGFRDQQTHLVDVFLNRLEDGLVSVVRYYFDRDPRRVECPQHGEREHSKSLRELASRHAEDRLLVFTDGSGLADPITGRLADWIELFSAWKERALMTPVAVCHWSSLEIHLAESGFRVLPASSAGLQLFTESLHTPEAGAIHTLTENSKLKPLYPEILIERPARWLDRTPPPREDLDVLCLQLRVHLGEDDFRWLCSLAVYPEINWHLILYLGLRLRRADGSSLIDEEALLTLTRLPWLRRGTFPDWLRLRLISELSPADEEEIRSLLQDLLQAQLEEQGSGFQLEIAQPHKPRMEARWKRLFSDFLRTEPQDSPLNDYVFVSYLLDKQPKSLQLSAPRAWHRWVYERGLRGLGLQTGPVLAIALSATVLGLLLGSLIDRVDAILLPVEPSRIIDLQSIPRLEMADLPRYIRGGEVISLTVRVINQGSRVDHDISVKILFPEPFAYAPGSLTLHRSDGTQEILETLPDPGQIREDDHRSLIFKAVEELQPGHMLTYNSDFTVGMYRVGEARFKAEGRTANMEETNAPTLETEKTTVVGMPALRLEMLDEPGVVSVGETSTVTVRVTNEGSYVDHDIDLKVYIPKLVAYISTEEDPQVEPLLEQEGDEQVLIFVTVKELHPSQSLIHQFRCIAKETGEGRLRALVSSAGTGGPAKLITETESMRVVSGISR